MFSDYKLVVGMQAGAATLENSMEVPQKVDNRATLQSSNCTTRYLPKVHNNRYLKDHMLPDIHSSIINNNQNVERAQMSFD